MHCTEARKHTATHIPQSQIHFNIVIDVNIDVNLALRVYVMNWPATTRLVRYPAI